MSAAAADAWTALGDPTRRRIFAEVAVRPQSVTALAERLPVSRPAVSQHLRVLREAELVSLRVEGSRHIYTVRTEGLARLRAELETFWGAALANFKALAEGTNTTEETPT
jgi:DNA-binding transcriptional ArsR family regulator